MRRAGPPAATANRAAINPARRGGCAPSQGPVTERHRPPHLQATATAARQRSGSTGCIALPSMYQVLGRGTPPGWGSWPAATAARPRSTSSGSTLRSHAWSATAAWPKPHFSSTAAVAGQRPKRCTHYSTGAPRRGHALTPVHPQATAWGTALPDGTTRRAAARSVCTTALQDRLMTAISRKGRPRKSRCRATRACHCLSANSRNRNNRRFSRLAERGAASHRPPPPQREHTTLKRNTHHTVAGRPPVASQAPSATARVSRLQGARDATAAMSARHGNP